MWWDHLPASVVFCDVETTGLGSDDRIVSFGGIGMISRELARGRPDLDYLYLVFDPGRRKRAMMPAIPPMIAIQTMPGMKNPLAGVVRFATYSAYPRAPSSVDWWPAQGLWPRSLHSRGDDVLLRGGRRLHPCEGSDHYAPHS